MKNLQFLQQNIEHYEDEINDLLGVSVTNIQVMKSQENRKTTNQLPQKHNKVMINTNNSLQQLNNQSLSRITSLLKSLLQIFPYQRTQMFSHFLIQRQISHQQQQMQTDRLLQYQQRLFQIRRNICDKQSFYQKLLRPECKGSRKNTSSSMDSSAQQTYKYRMLLEEIDSIKQFGGLLEKKQRNQINANKNNLKGIKSFSQQQRQKQTSKHPSINSLLNKNQLVNIFLPHHHKSQNTSSLNSSIASDRIKFHSKFNQAQTIQNTSMQDESFEQQQQTANNIQKASIYHRMSIYSQRSLKTIQFSKRKQLKKIQNQYKKQKKLNSYPLPFNTDERITITMENQMKAEERRLNKIEEIMEKINRKKNENVIKGRQLKQTELEIAELAKLLKRAKDMYNNQ